MKGAFLLFCAAVLLAGSHSACAQGHELGPHTLELLRLLAERPWLRDSGRIERTPRSDNLPAIEARTTEDDNAFDDSIRVESSKRSAVATALNAGRRRRQPEPALGKAVAPYMGVGKQPPRAQLLARASVCHHRAGGAGGAPGDRITANRLAWCVLNDMGTFFDVLRDNLETLALLSPEERGQLFPDTPTVIHAPSSGGGGGLGAGMRKLHALRPLRPTGNIRSYNRRSFVEADSIYPGANHHDPGLLWAGLGR